MMDVLFRLQLSGDRGFGEFCHFRIVDFVLKKSLPKVFKVEKLGEILRVQFVKIFLFANQHGNVQSSFHSSFCCNALSFGFFFGDHSVQPIQVFRTIVLRFGLGCAHDVGETSHYYSMNFNKFKKYSAVMDCSRFRGSVLTLQISEGASYG